MIRLRLTMQRGVKETMRGEESGRRSSRWKPRESQRWRKGGKKARRRKMGKIEEEGGSKRRIASESSARDGTKRARKG